MPASHADRRERAARCHRASSRNVAPSRRRRRCSARTRRRAGRRFRPAPSRAELPAPSRRHPARSREAPPCPPLRPSPQQEKLDRGRRGNLGRATEPTVARVIRARQSRDGAIERVLTQWVGGGLQQGAAGQPLAQALTAGPDLLTALVPRLPDRLQHLRPRGHSRTRLGREVGSAVERQLLGREEHVQRPAAVAGHRLDGLHVQRVHVGALLAVDLHAHELLVHQHRRALVLEGLALHHVAPVAGRIADRDEQRLVLRAGACQCRRSPWQPVDRVVGVLAQVRGGLVGQCVRHR